MGSFSNRSLLQEFHYMWLYSEEDMGVGCMGGGWGVMMFFIVVQSGWTTEKINFFDI